MWNVNAVLMGGLGKDPIIAETHGIFQKDPFVKEISSIICANILLKKKLLALSLSVY